MYWAYASPSCLRTGPFQIRAIIVPPRPRTSPPVVGAKVVFRIQEVAVRRAQVIEVLRGALLPLAWVNAAWLGGSDAFGRADELSDVDLQVDVDDGHVAATFCGVPGGAGAASPIAARLVMPMPTWHGHAQRFYRLRDTAETTPVDGVGVGRSDHRLYYN